MLDATRDNIAITDREDVSDTITSIDDRAGHVSDVVQVVLGILALLCILLVCDLRVQRQGRLHSNEEALDIECLKHDLGHLLSIFWSV